MSDKPIRLEDLVSPRKLPRSHRTTLFSRVVAKHIEQSGKPTTTPAKKVSPPEVKQKNRNLEIAMPDTAAKKNTIDDSGDALDAETRKRDKEKNLLDLMDEAAQRDRISKLAADLEDKRIKKRKP